jgi:hypothetical protein
MRQPASLAPQWRRPFAVAFQRLRQAAAERSAQPSMWRFARRVPSNLTTLSDDLTTIGLTAIHPHADRRLHRSLSVCSPSPGSSRHMPLAGRRAFVIQTIPSTYRHPERRADSRRDHLSDRMAPTPTVIPTGDDKRPSASSAPDRGKSGLLSPSASDGEPGPKRPVILGLLTEQSRLGGEGFIRRMPLSKSWRSFGAYSSPLVTSMPSRVEPSLG